MKTPRTLEKERRLRLAEMESERDEPTLLELLVGLVSKTATAGRIGPEKAVTLRLPADIACRLDAMVEVAGCSRNELATDMLEYALTDVMDELPKDVAQKVEDIFQRTFLAGYDLSRLPDAKK